MRKLKALQIAVACALALAATALLSERGFAQAKVGSTGMQSLELEVSARGMAMGGAFTAVVDDASAVWYRAYWPVDGAVPVL